MDNETEGYNLVVRRVWPHGYLAIIDTPWFADLSLCEQSTAGVSAVLTSIGCAAACVAM
jgi:hypothetical protein